MKSDITFLSLVALCAMFAVCTYLVLAPSLSSRPEIFYQGCDTSHAQPSQQHHEDSSNIGNAQGGGLPTLGLFLEIVLTFRYGDKDLQFPDTFRGLLWVLTAFVEISRCYQLPEFS